MLVRLSPTFAPSCLRGKKPPTHFSQAVLVRRRIDSLHHMHYWMQSIPAAIIVEAAGAVQLPPSRQTALFRRLKRPTTNAIMLFAKCSEPVQSNTRLPRNRLLSNQICQLVRSATSLGAAHASARTPALALARCRALRPANLPVQHSRSRIWLQPAVGREQYRWWLPTAYCRLWTNP